MSEEKVQEYLSLLHNSECLQYDKQALIVINNLQQCFTSTMSPSTADVLMAITLDAHLGLVGFISKMFYCKTHNQSLEAGLMLLEFLITNFKKYVEPHVVKICSTCAAAVLQDINYNLRVKCVVVIQALLTETAARDVDIPALVHSFKMCIISQPTNTVLAQLLEFLGFVSEKFPEHMQAEESWFIQKLLDVMAREVSLTKTTSSKLLEGCFKAISCYLVHFPQTTPQCKKNHDKIYQMLQMCRFQKGRRSMVGYRTGLIVIERHADQFKNDLFGHYRAWDLLLSEWVTSGDEHKKLGYVATLSFYKQIANIITLEDLPNSLEVFNFFTNKFIKIIKHLHEHDVYTGRLAILGLSDFSQCYSKYSFAEFQPVFQLILHRAQQTPLSEAGSHGYYGAVYFPSYLQCVSTFISHFTLIQYEEVSYLEKLSVMLIDYFPKIRPQFHGAALHSVASTVFNLLRCEAVVIDSYIDNIIYQGLIRSCAHPVLIDVELLEEQGLAENLTSYKSYMPLWLYLLNLATKYDLQDVNVKRYVAGKVFDSFIRSFLAIISKLNLDTITESYENSDPERTFEADKPRDFQILINLIDIYRDAIPQTEAELLEPWVTRILTDMITRAYTRPLVSGFNKVVSCTMQRVHDLKLFEDREVDEQIRQCQTLLTRYLEDTLRRVPQLKGDLQVSCMQVLFTAPCCLLKNMLHLTSGLFTAAMNMGQTYLPLIEECLNTLERWNNELTKEEMAQVMTDVLPRFDSFLRGYNTHTESYLLKAPDRKSERIRYRGKVVKKTCLEEVDSQVLSLQRKMLLFLGKLDPNVSVLMVEHSNDSRFYKADLAKYTLTYDIPYQDMKPAVNLGVIVPRVCDLSLHSGDRKTRMLACEVLHALIMYVLGTLKPTDNTHFSKNALAELLDVFRLLTQTCLHLGCSLDGVVYQLFNPLLFRMCRYFSGKSLYNREETSVLIEAMMVGLVNDSDAAIRDFSAKCIQEYVTWVIKQTPERETNTDPFNISMERILKYMFNYCLHPSYSRRLGAAVMFNHLYSILREEIYFLHVYWIEIYYFFVNSLKLNEPTEDATQTLNAVKHLERPLIDKQEIFNTQHPERKKPQEFNTVLLSDVVLWTFGQCKTTHRLTRKVAMDLVLKLSKVVTNCDSLKMFLDLHLPKAKDLQSSGPSMPSTDSTVSVLWLTNFSTLLDYHRWLLSADVDLDNISAVLESIVIFANTIHDVKVEDDDPCQRMALCDAKAFAVLDLFEFLCELIEKSKKVHNIFENEKIWKIIVDVMFKPSYVGFDMSFKETRDKVKSGVHKLLNLLVSHLEASQWAMFYDKVENVIQSQSYSLIQQLWTVVNQKQVTKECIEFLQGLEIAQQCSMWHDLTDNTSLKATGSIILKNVFDASFTKKRQLEVTVPNSSLASTYCQKLVTLALHDLDVNDVITYVLDSSIVEDQDTNKKLSKGKHFFLTYRNQLTNCITKQSSLSIDLTLRNSHQESITFFMTVLGTIYNQKDLKNDFVQLLYDAWPRLETISFDSESKKRKVLLSLIKSMVQTEADPVGVLKGKKAALWVYNILQNNLQLDEVSTIFSVLPCCSDNLETHNTELAKALAKMKSCHMLFSGGDISKTSPEYTIIFHIYSSLLKSLSLTKSLVILDFIANIIPSHEKYIEVDALETALFKFQANAPESHLLEAFNLLYKLMSASDGSYPITSGKLLTILLRISSKNVVTKFYECYISAIHRIITNKLPVGNSALHAATIKMELLRLIQILYILFDKHEILNIVETSLLTFGSELPARKTLESLFVFCYKGETVTGQEDVNRKFQCTLYNTLCSIICNSSTVLAPYSKFLFSTTNPIWYLIMDSRKCYTLPVEFVEIPQHKKLLTSIRKAATHDLQVQMNQVVESRKYVNSQSLVDSTLFEDILKFDFTNASIKESQEEFEFNIQLTSSKVEVELEMDSINEHECMATVCGVIAHMVTENITPPPTANELEPTAPVWLLSILNTLQDPAAHVNTKLFLLKLICNINKYVTPYARCTIPVLLRVILTLFHDKPINYLLSDLLVMILSWNTVYVPGEELQEPVMQLLQMFILNAESPRRDVFKHNIEVIKTLVEVWKPALNENLLSSLVFNILMDETSLTIHKRPENITKVQLCNILLANKIPPWIPQNEARFLHKLASFVEHDPHWHHKAAAEICGLSLSYLSSMEVNIKEYVDIIIQCLNNIYLTKRDNFETSRLYLVHKHYQPISDCFLSKLTDVALSGSGEFELHSMEMILGYLGRMKTFDKNYLTIQLKSIIVNKLKGGGAEVQELALQILKSYLRLIPSSQVEELLCEALKFSKHSHPVCRRLVYETVIDLFEKLTESTDLRAKLKLVLLDGLSDPEPELQNLCFEFWCNRKLPVGTCQRILFTLQELYVPNCDSDFIEYFIRFVLDATSLSVDFKNNIFNFALADCEFQVQEISNSISTQHTTLVPMFAQTIASQMTNPEILTSLKGTKNLEHHIRATLPNLLFAPTATDVANTDQPTTFLIGTTTSVPVLDNRFKVPQEIVKSRRFRQARDERSYFAKKQSLKKQKELEQDLKRIKKRNAEVKLYRQYRIGDFPDIAIPHSQLLVPLQALAARDLLIGRRLTVAIISGILKYKHHALDYDQSEFTTQLNKLIKLVLEYRASSDYSLLSVMLNIALELKECEEYDTKSIALASCASGLVPGGVLLIEKILMNVEEEHCLKSKRAKGIPNQRDIDWLQLAALYQKLGESDVLHGIFVDKLKVDHTVQKALRDEVAKRWKSVCQGYVDIIERDPPPSDEYLEFYRQSYFTSLANLSNWNALNQSVVLSVDNNLERLWQSDWCLEKFLPWFVRSVLMYSVQSNTLNFKNVFDSWSQDGTKLPTLKANYSKELALFYNLLQEAQKSKYYVSQYCLQFLQTWSELNPLLHKLRLSKLMELQLITEIEAISSIIGEVDTSEREAKLLQLNETWRKNLPQRQDDLTVWDSKLTFRHILLTQLKNIPDIELEIKIMEKTVATAALELCRAGVEQGNSSLVQTYLKIASTRLSNINDIGLKLEYQCMLILLKYVRATQNEEPLQQSVELVNVWSDIIGLTTMAKEYPDLRIMLNYKLSNIVTILASLVNNHDISVNSLHVILQTETINRQQAYRALQELGLTYLKDSAQVHVKDNYVLADTYLSIAKYCRKLKNVRYQKEIAVAILRSMQYGNSEGRQLFCSLLHSFQPEENEEFVLAFKSESERVPTWMFLQWTSQLLALLTTNMYQLVVDLLLRVAKDYPKALVYNFRLSKEKFVFPDTPEGAQQKVIVANLSEILLNDVLIENFVNAVRYIGPPLLMLKYYVEKLFLSVKKTQNSHFEYAKEGIEHLFSDPIASEFEKLQVYKPEVENILTTFSGSNQIQWKKNTTEFLRKLENSIRKAELRSSLKRYSKWCSAFQSFNYDKTLELPGQYEGISMPMPKYHVTVNSFKDEIIILNSKSKPFRITIVGNDAKEYRYMVKFSEDLRLDARIQQVLRYMSSVLEASCSQLCVKTYSVVPITCDIGLIQWVDNTLPLDQIIKNSTPNAAQLVDAARVEHTMFLCKDAPNTQTAYETAYRTMGRTTAIQGFNLRTRTLPWDALKKTFWNMSTSSEHFLFIRNNFSTSHSVLCIVHWLLAIGDRHLQNSLVSRTTGRVLGIDFGYSFGTSQCLNPPELIPFRLTPQIINLMKPLNETGFIKGTMVRTLTVLRSDPTVLLAMLEVFVLEPLLDWVQHATKRTQSTDGSSVDLKWYPQQKISAVKRKLEGENPLCLIKEDIESGYLERNSPHYLKAILELLTEGRNADEWPVREAEEQVEVMIDLATDPHVLCKTYVGWDPWL